MFTATVIIMSWLYRTDFHGPVKLITEFEYLVTDKGFEFQQPNQLSVKHSKSIIGNIDCFKCAKKKRNIDHLYFFSRTFAKILSWNVQLFAFLMHNLLLCSEIMFKFVGKKISFLGGGWKTVEKSKDLFLALNVILLFDKIYIDVNQL